MIYFVPDGMGEMYEIKSISGSLHQKLSTILQASDDDDLIVELDDQSYSLLRSVIRAVDVDYSVVINVPDIPTPRSYLYEDDINVVKVYNDEVSAILAAVMNKQSSELDKKKEQLLDSEQITEMELEGVGSAFLATLR